MERRIIKAEVFMHTHDRRLINDRRKRPTPFPGKHIIFCGRRRTFRREEDKKTHIFVDHYSLKLFITILLLLLLSVFDAYLTLALVKERVIVEANPIMALYLEHGDLTFFLEKLLLTSVAVFIFCVFNHFSVTRISLSLAIIIYLGVVFYEVSIMNNFFM